MAQETTRPAGGKHHVVIVGAGFGGMKAAKKFKKDENVAVTIIDRTNYHLFQPLLYQVATGILGTGSIAPTIRKMLAKQKNATVVKAEVRDINVSDKTVTADLGGNRTVYEYDTLIVAAGAGQSYFGNDQFAQFAPGMKSIDDALEIRARLTGAFERASLAKIPEERQRFMTFVVIGAGPTGTELAGQLAELAHRTLPKEYKNLDTNEAKIILLDGGPAALLPMGEKLSKKATQELERIGVTPRMNAFVTNIDQQGVTFKDAASGEETFIPSYCKIWSAGVAASPLGKMVADQLDVEADRAGRVPVNEDLTVGSDKNVFVIGDMTFIPGIPGMVQPAMQGGTYVAKTVSAELAGKSDPAKRTPFKYRDKGTMAIVSRFFAVVNIKNKVEYSGFFAWISWLVLHMAYLDGILNKITAAMTWLINIFNPNRWQLVSSRQQLHARNAMNALAKIENNQGTRSIEIYENIQVGKGVDTQPTTQG